MNIHKIIKSTEKPELYEKGTAQMWTDPYISRQLLNVHLNKEIDMASRKLSTIESTVNWILSKAKGEKLRILDLGCGPGLYAEQLGAKGHSVTGVDFSEHSINYAKAEAVNKKLDIEYIRANYLELNLPENSFDLVMIIYTDFGVLTPSERDQLLAIIKKVLKPDGYFIFDVLNDRDLDQKVSPRSWEVAEKGFWRDKPYMALSESFFYPEKKVVLNQHLLIEENEKIDIYRFWAHFFSNNDLTEIMGKHDFQNPEFYTDVLPKGDIWTGENVTFCKVVNVK